MFQTLVCLSSDCTHTHIIQGFAALARLYGDELDRKTFVAGKTLRKIIWCAAAGDRVQWYFNSIRLRHSIESSYLSLLGSGTSPNESLHAEVNRWFRNQQELYSTTLALQLQVNSLGKLLSHNSALYRPTLVQRKQTIVLTAVACTLSISPTDWQEFCKKPAALKLALKRKQLSKLVRMHITKKPAANPRRVKRTPFNLKRIKGSL